MADELRGSDDLMARLEGLRDGTASRQVLGRFGLLAVQRAKERVPRKTGNLDRTIRVGELDVQAQRVTIVAGGTGRVGANQYGVHSRGAVGYARFVEFGTRPHVIRPKTKKALAWGGTRRLSGELRKGSKATNFARVVNHPGTRAKPYLRPGAEQALAEVGLADVVVSVWNDAA
jgi:hypothetical protein